MNNKYIKDIQSILLLVVATILQVFTLQAIVRPANLLPSGFLGLSVLIQTMTNGIVPGGIPLNISSLVLNILVSIICFKGISRRFIIYSLCQVMLSSFLLTVLTFEPIFDNVMLSVVVGGALNGLYVTAALMGNASTGGTDFIALYVSNKKGKSIWEYVFLSNVVLLLIFGFTSGWEPAAFSILFQFIATKTIETFHHRYEQLTVQITTSTPKKVMDYYFDHYKHGMSCIEGIGGYSNQKIYILFTVVSSYELKDITKGILASDPKAIINVMRTQQFFGNFYRQKQ